MTFSRPKLNMAEDKTFACRYSELKFQSLLLIISLVTQLSTQYYKPDNLKSLTIDFTTCVLSLTDVQVYNNWIV